jgi:predicted metal-dependent hydrolase
MTPGLRDHFKDGVDLFNAGRFFECHEAWEQVWLRSPEPEKTTIQGLIQAAVAILHMERGNRAGAASLGAKAMEKLARAPADFGGIDMDHLRGTLERFFAAALDTSGLIPPNRPRIRMIAETD